MTEEKFNLLEYLEKLTSQANDYLSYVLIGILVLGGIYFTFRTRFVQFRLFKVHLMYSWR